MKALCQKAVQRLRLRDSTGEPIQECSIAAIALRQAMQDSGIEMPSREKGSKRRKKNKRQHVREDIFARTLQQHSND